MHFSLAFWIVIIIVAAISITVALDVFFDIDITRDTPLLRLVLGIFWAIMACVALRDVIVRKPLSIDAVLGFAFCLAGVVYAVWPRHTEDLGRIERKE